MKQCKTGLWFVGRCCLVTSLWLGSACGDDSSKEGAVSSGGQGGASSDAGKGGKAAPSAGRGGAAGSVNAGKGGSAGERDHEAGRGGEGGEGGKSESEHAGAGGAAGRNEAAQAGRGGAAGSKEQAGKGGAPEGGKGGSWAGAGGSAGMGGPSGAGGSKDNAADCAACEAAEHELNGLPNYTCRDSVMRCDMLQGNTAADSPIMPGTSKAKLCRAMLDCMHKEHCDMDSKSTDCLCGKGVDPDDCFSTGSYEKATGACKELAAAGGETTDMAKLSQNYFDPTFAVGAAVTVIETCDQFFCEFECL